MRKIWLKMTLFALACSAALLQVSATSVMRSEQERERELWQLTGGTAEYTDDPACRSAVLMEAQTGRILYEKNADQGLPPASVTKIMTLLLVMEAIADGQLQWTDTVSASAHACSMGGSQIYLKEHERMSVEDLVKSVVIASANDAAVALAEHIAGSESSFVRMMNDKALRLDMQNTHFENTNGLDDTVTNHYTSARDIAIMSRELIRHERILEYSALWMDSIRDGAFGLTNTNRLVRFYQGCNGLKTGSTSKAGFCVSATAKRDGMTLICVVMGAENRDVRNKIATELLDWGFANYGLFSAKGGVLTDIAVKCGTQSTLQASYGDFYCLLPKGKVGKVKATAELKSESFTAPVPAGDKLGRVVYTVDEEQIGSVSILSAQNVPRIGFWGVLCRVLAKYLLI